MPALKTEVSSIQVEIQNQAYSQDFLICKPLLCLSKKKSYLGGCKKKFFHIFFVNNCTILLFFLYGFYTLRLFVCFNFIFNINAQIAQYLIVSTFEVRMIYVHSGFFLWLLLLPFINICKRKKNEKLKKSISKETKGRLKQSCDREQVCF